ncbi:cytochrome P450, partial [Coniella lustricola]
RDVVDFTYTGFTPVLRDRLQLRAGPNARLIQAFGIDNSFTTTDPSVHKAFQSAARKPLQELSQERWSALFDEAIRIIKQEKNLAMADDDVQKSTYSISLAQCVRRLCFEMVFHILFGTKPGTLSRQDVNIAALEINSQWLISKAKQVNTKSTALNSALLHLIAHSSNPATSSEAALNLILPAYETLWRVILLTFVSACHRQQDSNVLDTLNGLPGCLGRGDGEEQQVRLLAKEGLRLFPSTKRVHRCASLQDFCPNKIVSADIEACQRDPYIWGKDAPRFRPGRFEHLTGLQKNAYMPFGLRPHMCPASAAFGERMIVLLVGALHWELGKKRAKVLFNDPQLDGIVFKDLPTGRADTENW